MTVPAPEVDEGELRSAIEAILGEDSGRTVEVAELRRAPHPYRTSHALHELTVVLADGTPLDLLLKDVGRAAIAPEAVTAKPAFLADPLREIETYRRLLLPHGLAGAYRGAVTVPEHGRYWLFLEKIDGPPLWQVGELETWQAVARHLARMHAEVRPHPDVPLVRYDAGYYRTWLRRAESFLVGASLSALSRRHEEAIERLERLPKAVVHGELYPSNVLVHDAGGERVVIVDWELAGWGPALVDVAALTSGKGWAREQADEIALTYRGALPSPPSEEAFKDGLDVCRLHLAVRWLGWSRRWTPPPEHAHDWLEEALAAAERLGLGRQ